MISILPAAPFTVTYCPTHSDWARRRVWRVQGEGDGRDGNAATVYAEFVHVGEEDWDGAGRWEWSAKVQSHTAGVSEAEAIALVKDWIRRGDR